jgi:hypothetical protein
MHRDFFDGEGAFGVGDGGFCGDAHDGSISVVQAILVSPGAAEVGREGERVG